MLIGISALDNQGLDSKMDSRFGRANLFAVVDTGNMNIRFLDNTAAQADSGAGVGAAQLIADQKVDVLISGNYGPKAFSALNAANIELYSYSGGTIKEAVEAYNNGELKQIGGPTNNGHVGLR